MNDTTEKSTSELPEPPKQSNDAFKLALFALLTTALCVITFAKTEQKIADNISQLTIRKLTEVIPETLSEDHSTQDLTQQWIHISEPHLGLKKTKKMYGVQRTSRDEHWILPITAPDGYGGAINLLMGINISGEITGVRVVPPHNETPGLGDKIEIKKSDWIKRFNGKSLANTVDSNWAITKEGGDFDSFTGASITPRAVISAVHKGLYFFDQNRDRLRETAYQSEFTIK